MKNKVKKNINKVVPPKVPEKTTFTDAELIQALYWIWDAFDRSLMTMFLVYNTAEAALANGYLTGDKITVGVRGNEWRSGSTPILLAFTGIPTKITDTHVVFKNPFNAVPVHVHVYAEDPCISPPQTIFWANEHFNIPNPYSRFLKVFGGSDE